MSPNQLFPAFTAVTILALPATSQDITLADIVPANTCILLATDDASAMQEAFERTPLNEWWNTDEVQQWATRTIDDFISDLNEDLENVELDRDSFVMPTGPVGIAYWVDLPEPGEVSPTPHFMIMGHFDGDGADTMASTFDDLIEEQREQDLDTITEVDYGDYVIITLGESEEEDDDGNMDDFDAWDDWDDDDGPFDILHYVRAGDRLLLTSSMLALQDALDRIDGDEIEALANIERYNRASADVREQQSYAVFLTEPLFELQRAMDEINADNADEWDPMAGMQFMPIFEALGLAEVRSASISFSLDTDAGIYESDYFVDVPEKNGLLALLDAEPADFEPPAFITGDVASVSLMQVQFDQILPTVQAVIRSLGEDMAQDAQSGMLMAQGIISPILDQLGPEIYLSQSFTKPYSAESMVFLAAVRAKDDTQLAASIAQPLEAFMQIKPRDFQGNQIFEFPTDGFFPPIAIGVGSGFLFISTNDAVENALRQAGEPGGVTLANEDSFQDSMDGVPSDGLSFGWASSAESLRYQAWMIENMDEIMRKQFESWQDWMSEEEFEEMIAESVTEFEESPFVVPNLEMLAEILGDGVGYLESVPEGYRGKAVLRRVE